ncbi:hypothetical protein JR316_0009781 [Psilocybe cubensis]|uniref:Uncharacterized protein n=1 Tax=Psilocybe cubensis TaxID=181762 RepID=A0ACB8GR94_PSICU|nr:hypothetical protein JR316_0009781 [Psilocybe cubensis]KAH9477559.1 hypothetical protein JR316_0009781 [Psilocybe cubensis]
MPLVSDFPEPPTKETLEDARRALETIRTSMQELTTKIDVAEATLAQIVRESQYAINELQAQRSVLEKQVAKTMAYLSPIRRLPMELLREVFMWTYEDHPCSAWVLAAVSRSWRRLALKTPLIWSKIRLLTTQHSSADTIRLWIERSGDNVPLDIEIFLRVANTKHSPEATAIRTRRTSSPLTPISIPGWNISFPAQNSSPHFVVAHAPLPPTVGNVAIIMPPSPPPHLDGWGTSSAVEKTTNTISKASMHWGHIAFFYLVEQMHRWERFVFRFDKQFTSMGALKSINGDAPLLKEFEVSSTEAGFFAEWPWLPNVNASSSSVILPQLRSLTLQHTPFKWSSPMLRGLHKIHLRGLPTSHLPLDRVLHILSNNPQLKTVSLHFQGILPAILPLSVLVLPHVTSLTLGGHFLLTQLLESLTLPSLESLTLDIEPRDTVEDVISGLLTRSGRPPLQHLSLAYSAGPNSTTLYYGPSGLVVHWTALLSELIHLKTLNIGGTSLEILLTALGSPEDDPSQNQNPVWACPALEVLGLRSCHAHNEGVNKLVQMVEARNPHSGTAQVVGGVTPVRLSRLELHECTNLGEDVMHWLNTRIGEVICSDPTESTL